MSAYEVGQAYAADPPLLPRFERFLFNETRHLHSQGEGATAFFLLNSTTQTSDARLSLFVRENSAVSPLRATLGGIEVAPDVPEAALEMLLEAVDGWAVAQKLTRIRLTQGPAAYAPGLAASLDAALKKAGYAVLFTDQNQHLALTGEPEIRLHESARRRLHKARRAGFVFSTWENPDWDFAHRFILAARQRKDLPLSLTAVELRKLGENFRDDVAVFTVRDGATVAALGVTIRLNARVLYHFLPADSAAYLPFSPTIFLNVGLADWARQRGFGLLDLGISTKLGVPNEGLLRFKRNLGAEVSEKRVYEKQLLQPVIASLR